MDQGKNVSPQWAPDGTVHRVRVRPQRRERHLPVRPGRARRSTSSPTSTPASRASPRSRPCCRGPARPTGWRSCTTRTRSTTSTPSPTRAASSGAPYQQPAVDSVGILARVATPPLDTTPLAAGARGGAVAGRRGRLDLPHPAGLPLLERPGPRPATRPSSSPAGLHQRADGFGQLQPAGHQRVHPEGVPGALHAGLHRPARRSATRATTSAGASSAGRRSRSATCWGTTSWCSPAT